MARKSRGKNRGHHREREHASPAPAARAARATPKLPPDRVVLALAFVGMLLTAYLSVVAWRGGGAAFCSAGSGCDVVQGSAWSRLFGVPIAAWGLALYALLAWKAWQPATTRLRRWRGLWRLSLVGLAISLYLTFAGVFALGATCTWCLLSLATISAIFAMVALRRPEGAPGATWGSWLLGSGLVALGLVAVLHVAATGVWQRPADPRLVALADHLQQAGVRYYGASWCANCQRQSKLFGAAGARLPYTECSPDGRGGGVAFECTAAGIGSYPTWVIGGQPYTGVIEPERLAKMTGFDWERPRGE